MAILEPKEVYIDYVVYAKKYFLLIVLVYFYVLSSQSFPILWEVQMLLHLTFYTLIRWET